MNAWLHCHLDRKPNGAIDVFLLQHCDDHTVRLEYNFPSERELKEFVRMLAELATPSDGLLVSLNRLV
jgi:hypothetical protein